VYWGTTTTSDIPCITDVGLLHPYYDTVLSTRTSDIISSFYSTGKVCDDIPRAVGTPTSVLSIQATITDFQWFPKADQVEAFSSKIMATPSLRPLLNPCSIQPRDCAQLWRNWERAYVSKIQNGGRGEVPNFPFCDYVTTNCNKCTIHGGEVKLIYFPVTPTSRDICAASTPSPAGSTFPLPFVANGMFPSPFRYINTNLLLATQTPAPSVVVEDNTFISGSAYISFQTVFASDACAGTTIGTPQIGGILPIQSADLSSLRYPFYAENAHPFNFADLNSPVPWSAYGAQSDCFLGNCQTISTEYNPQLMIPAAITSMDPAWAGCEVFWGGLRDPPSALHTANELTSPSAESLILDGLTALAPAPALTLVNSVAKSVVIGAVGPTALLPVPVLTDPHETALPTNDPVNVNKAFGMPTDPGASQEEPAVNGNMPSNGNPALVTHIGGKSRPKATGLPATANSDMVNVVDIIMGKAGNAAPNAAQFAEITPAPLAKGAVLTVAGQTLTADPSSSLIISGQTLRNGGAAATIDGKVISVGALGVIINPAAGQTGSATTHFFAVPKPSGGTTASLTLDGKVYEIQSLTGTYFIDSTTIKAHNTPVTVDGHVFEVNTAGLVIDGSKTVAFGPSNTNEVTFSDASGGQPVAASMTSKRASGKKLTVSIFVVVAAVSAVVLL
jgi:hypothetical protein